MKLKDKCSKCGGINQTEIISGGITMKVYREGDYTVRDEITYEKTDEFSKWVCTDCGADLE